MSEEVSILIVAGEDSGDQHAAGLIRRLRQICPQSSLDLHGSGGDRMASEGVDLMVHASELAAIGPRAALSNAAVYWKLYKDILNRVRDRRPQLAILVDFPEFNLLLARRLKDMEIPVCYFISPQIWAWRSGRVEKVRRYVDLMLVILPFEERFYQQHGVLSRYVGNPSLQRIREQEGQLQPPASTSGTDPRQVALMPGSRRKEIEQIFPLLLEAAGYIAERMEVSFRVVQANTVAAESLQSLYREWVKRTGIELNLEICREDTRRALRDVDFAIVKSGTSTLEAMLLEVPFAMVYRMSTLSWLFARTLVDIKTYCLANIVAGERIVEEFVQGDATAERIGGHVLALLQDEQSRRRMRRRLREASRKLGSRDAYLEAARLVADWVSLKKEAA